MNSKQIAEATKLLSKYCTISKEQKIISIDAGIVKLMLESMRSMMTDPKAIAIVLEEDKGKFFNSLLVTSIMVQEERDMVNEVRSIIAEAIGESELSRIMQQVKQDEQNGSDKHGQ